jgi:hypothetical protein
VVADLGRVVVDAGAVVAPAAVGGGIVSCWPASTWSGLRILLAASSCATVTPNILAMLVSVSPFCTM